MKSGVVQLGMSTKSRFGTIRIEFYGVPRQRAGTSAIDVPVDGESVTLSELLFDVGSRFAEFSECCLEQGRLRKQYIANIDGQKFVDDPAEVIHAGSSLLIMSADAGG